MALCPGTQHSMRGWMLPCPSPPVLCRAATGAGDTAAEWPWCGDSSLNAHGDLCGQRPAKELLSLLTALEWGGLAVLRLLSLGALR